MTGRRIVTRIVLPAALGVIAIGLIAPFLSARQFRPRIEAALESALQRKVHVGDVHFNLFTGPGFTLDNVVIEEDPRVGIEPFAYMDSLEARVRLRSLWAGHLSFSTLRLIDPSVNLMKVNSGGWNVQPLLRRAGNAGTAHPNGQVPDIEVRDGRLNFKFGLRKSVFYVNNADLDIYPGDNEALVIDFSGEPSRTDRGAQGFGRVTARGMLMRPPGREPELRMGIELERSSIGALTTLLEGHDLGVHGTASGNAHLAGPLSSAGITGDVRIEDLHRWDLMPRESEPWLVHLRGDANLRKQTLDIQSASAQGEPVSPVDVRFRATDYFRQPKWAAFLTLHGLPATHLIDIARHFGVAVPQQLRVSGKVDGVVGYGRPGGIQGQLLLEDGAIAPEGGGGAKLGPVPVLLSNGRIDFGPADVAVGDDRDARFQGSYSGAKGRFDLQITSKLLKTSDVDAALGGMLPSSPVPLLADCKQGVWHGALEFSKTQDAPGTWTGAYELRNAQISLPGFSTPLRIAQASVSLQPGRLQISHFHGRIEKIEYDGEFRHDIAGPSPDHLQLTIASLDLADLERAMQPVLQRREGLLARLRFRKPIAPEWLKNRHIGGGIRIGSLQAGETALGSLRAKFLWDGTTVRFTNADWSMDDAHGTGELTVHLGSPAPQFRLAGSVEGIPYRDGSLDMEGQIDTSGTGLLVLANAKGDGSFTGNDLTLGPDLDAQRISGMFHLAAGGDEPRVTLDHVEMTQGQEMFTGQGASQDDGRIVLDLISGRKQVRYVAYGLGGAPAAETPR